MAEPPEKIFELNLGESEKKITFLCDRFWEWTKYFLEISYTSGTSTPHIPEYDSAFLGIYPKMTPFLLFLLCKCFFWEQLSQLSPQLELWMESRSNTSSFLFLQQRGRMHRNAFTQIVMFRELSFYYFLDSMCYFHFHFSAWLRVWLVWRWTMVEQGLTSWKKELLLCPCYWRENFQTQYYYTEADKWMPENVYIGLLNLGSCQWFDNATIVNKCFI